MTYIQLTHHRNYEKILKTTNQCGVLSMGFTDKEVRCNELLKELPTTPVTDIDWHIDAISESQAADLIKHLKKQMASLRSFSLTCANMAPTVEEMLLKTLSDMTNLEKLILNDPLTEAVHFDALDTLCSNNPNLVHISLIAHPKPFPSRVDAIFNLSSLKHLSLTGFNVSQANLKNLAQLSMLRLDKCELGNILKQLAQITGITTLELANNPLSLEQVALISQYITAQPVEKLVLTKAQLNDTHNATLLPAFATNKTLKNIDLSNNQFTSDIATKLKNLKKTDYLPKLQHLNLLHNKIGVFDPTLTALQQILSASKSSSPSSSKNHVFMG